MTEPISKTTLSRGRDFSESIHKKGSLGEKEITHIRPPSQITEVRDGIINRDFQGILMGCCLIELVAGIVLWSLGSAMGANPMMIGGIVLFSFGFGGSLLTSCCVLSLCDSP